VADVAVAVCMLVAVAVAAVAACMLVAVPVAVDAVYVDAWDD
jgi:hypothetical protein